MILSLLGCLLSPEQESHGDAVCWSRERAPYLRVPGGEGRCADNAVLVLQPRRRREERDGQRKSGRDLAPACQREQRHPVLPVRGAAGEGGVSLSKDVTCPRAVRSWHLPQPPHSSAAHLAEGNSLFSEVLLLLK